MMFLFSQMLLLPGCRSKTRIILCFLRIGDSLYLTLHPTVIGRGSILKHPDILEAKTEEGGWRDLEGDANLGS